jgi:2-isopropylmalate synthase
MPQFVQPLNESGAGARARITIGGRTVEAEGVGDGPVDASYAAIAQATKMQVDLEDFSLVTTGKGSEAIGEATVRIREYRGTTTATGRGASIDIVQASALAYIDALNKMTQAKQSENEAVRPKSPSPGSPRLGGG